MPRASKVQAPVQDDGFYVAIPSYQRWRSLGSKTLALLRRHGVSPERVYIFVASKEEYRHYFEELGSEWPNIIVGVLKLWKQRNFITRFFAEGTYVISMDDDLEEFYELQECLAGKGDNEEGTGLSLKELCAGGLRMIADDAKHRMQRYGAYLWSFNVSDNPFYMKRNRVTKTNGLCNGFFWGCINRHDQELILQFGDGHEDVERSVRYFQKDGVVLRYRFLCAKTKCKSNRGGLQASMTAPERRVEEDKSAAVLVQEFPHMLKLAPGSILGLKFLSGRVSPLMRCSVLSKAQFQFLAGKKRLDVLVGSIWACEEESGLVAGIIERCQGEQLLLGTFVPEGKGHQLYPSAYEFYQKMLAQALHVLEMPEAACKALGVAMHELPKGIDKLIRPWKAESSDMLESTKSSKRKQDSDFDGEDDQSQVQPDKKRSVARPMSPVRAPQEDGDVALTYMRKLRWMEEERPAAVHVSHYPVGYRGVLFCQMCGAWKMGEEDRLDGLTMDDEVAAEKLGAFLKPCPTSITSRAGDEWLTAIEHEELPAPLAAAGLADWPEAPRPPAP